MVTSENFIQELKNRNPDALDYVLDTFGNLIYKICYMNLNSKELSEECVNDVLMKVWENINNYSYPENKFKNWVATISKYTSIDKLRKEKRHFNTLPDENIVLSSKEEIEDSYINREDLNLVKKYICQFKELDKNIFIQRFFMNKSLKEIGDLYKLSPKAVNLRILRARKKVKKINR